MKILKISAPFISSPLCCIIKLPLNLGVFPARLKYSIITPLHKRGVFPTRLKYSIITPLHKRGDKNVTNYRPISLLTSFSKIFEKLYIKD